MDEVEDVSTNPWIYATREVIEQILLYRGRASGHRVDCESDICKKTRFDGSISGVSTDDS